MTETAPARTAEQRKQDTLDRLAGEVDAWVATAGPEGGAPYMMPLSFLWRDGVVWISTRETNPLARNLLAGGTVHLGIGRTRDVVHVIGACDAVPEAEISAELGDAFAERTGFDPRATRGAYVYFAVRPVRIQAWREANELTGRDLMRDGKWLVEG
ncbi:pyridoxamine 5'-phosphate oxidase family protein [Streptomyces sp. KL116D]|uniref:pyridoxamine 5'-phosphate oxidase family protein n=1 Tax=Streptomyces sp. KL116D TaxID=3045152 RepID=UPI003557D5CA